MPASFLDYAKRLISVPTAPFREQWVAAELDCLIAGIPGLQAQVDRFGNRIVRLTRGTPQGALPIFVAHLDHPGFLLDGNGAFAQSGSTFLYRAKFEGRVMTEFFPGSPVRLFRHADDTGVPGIVRAVEEESSSTDNRNILLETKECADGAVLAMWDVPVFDVKPDGWLHARVCDDLAGVAALLEMLRRLATSDAEHLDVAVVFSRAEEAGFCGVLCMMAEEQLHPLLSADGIFISVENSSERPGVSCGDGAIIRLGDRMSTFDGPTTDHLWRVAKAREIRARRMLMDGGTCEATVFARQGYRASGVCIPLRHYHNMDRREGRIAAEVIHLDDAIAIVDMMTAFTLHHSAAPDSGTGMDFDLFLQKGLAQLQYPELAAVKR